ncbi:hypothetical protein CR513_57546, partial [Mucuna pruriens]
MEVPSRGNSDAPNNHIKSKPRAGTGGVMRSERVFALKNLRNKDPTPVKKEKIIGKPKRVVMEEEIHEFLKMIRHSEYEMLDQLHKKPTRISLLSLLINSESH